MTCPKCKSEDVMTTRTHTKESVKIRGWFWKSEREPEEKTVTHKCLDCGHEWGTK
jgi:uncharacterized OB-fold protein